MEEVHLCFMVYCIILVFLYVVRNTLVHQGVPLHDGHVQVFHSSVDFPVYLSKFTHENKFVHVCWETMWLIFVKLGNQILQALHKLPLNCLHFFRILQWCSICKIGLDRVISLLKLLALSELQICTGNHTKNCVSLLKHWKYKYSYNCFVLPDFIYFVLCFPEIK